MVPSYRLNQCWIIVNWTLRNGMKIWSKLWFVFLISYWKTILHRYMIVTACYMKQYTRLWRRQTVDSYKWSKAIYSSILLKVIWVTQVHLTGNRTMRIKIQNFSLKESSVAENVVCKAVVILSQSSGVKLDKPVIDKPTTQAVFAALLISTLGPDCRCNYVDIGIYHCNSFHDDVIKWKHYRALLAICAGNSPVPSPRKNSSDAELWCFLWSASG